MGVDESSLPDVSPAEVIHASLTCTGFTTRNVEQSLFSVGFKLYLSPQQILNSRPVPSMPTVSHVDQFRNASSVRSPAIIFAGT